LTILWALVAVWTIGTATLAGAIGATTHDRSNKQKLTAQTDNLFVIVGIDCYRTDARCQ
jgi:hypothetical protein